MKPAVLLFLGSLLLAACQPSTSTSASPTIAASNPAPSESAAAICDPGLGIVCSGPLPAGDYRSETTGALVEFTLDEHDWSGLPDTPGVGFGLLLADVPDAAISALAFGGEYYTDACLPTAGTTVTGRSPAGFIAMLTARPGVVASDPVQVEVGGWPALQVDLTTDIDAACAATGDGQIWVWPLPLGGPFDLYDMEMARIIAVDAGSATVILVAEARSTVEDYDHFLEHFEEVLETISISPL